MLRVREHASATVQTHGASLVLTRLDVNRSPNSAKSTQVLAAMGPGRPVSTNVQWEKYSQTADLHRSVCWAQHGTDGAAKVVQEKKGAAQAQTIQMEAKDRAISATEAATCVQRRI